MDNLTLYSHRDLKLTVDLVSQLTSGADIRQHDDTLVVAWGDVTVKIHHLPGGGELVEHLRGFQGYIRSCAGDDQQSVAELLGMIGGVKAVLGCQIEPAFDDELKSKSLLVSIAATLEQCFMFYEGAILSPFGEVWFGPDNMAPLADIEQLKVCKVNLTPFPTGTADQRKRYERVNALMNGYAVPELSKRVWVDDAEAETLRTPQDVARRVLALHAVVCIARGRPRDQTLHELKESGAEAALSPTERAFLENDPLPEDERQSMIWRLEALWVLMWALRHIDKFTWPSEMCDVEGLHELIFAKSKDPQAFIQQAKLRSPRSLLDAAQLIIQLQAVIRTAYLEEQTIPANLNWKKPTQIVPVRACPSTAIVSQRHHTLNWLRNFQQADWDDVDTPTIPSAIL